MDQEQLGSPWQAHYTFQSLKARSSYQFLLLGAQGGTLPRKCFRYFWEQIREQIQQLQVREGYSHGPLLDSPITILAMTVHTAGFSQKWIGNYVAKHVGNLSNKLYYQWSKFEWIFLVHTLDSQMSHLPTPWGTLWLCHLHIIWVCGHYIITCHWPSWQSWSLMETQTPPSLSQTWWNLLYMCHPEVLIIILLRTFLRTPLRPQKALGPFNGPVLFPPPWVAFQESWGFKVT